MDEKGLWELFYATGAPAVWLAIRQEQAASGADMKDETPVTSGQEPPQQI